MILKYITVLILVSLASAQVNSGISVSLNSNNLNNLFKKAAKTLEEPVKGLSLPIIIPNYRVAFNKANSFLKQTEGEVSSSFTEDNKMVVTVKKGVIEGSFHSSVTKATAPLFVESSSVKVKFSGEFTFTAKLNSLYGEETALALETVQEKDSETAVTAEGYFASNIKADLENAFSRNKIDLLKQMGKAVFDEKLTIFLRKARIALTSSLKLDLSMADEKFNLAGKQFSFFPLGTVFAATARTEPKSAVPANFEGLAEGESRVTISKFPFESFLFTVTKKNALVKIDKDRQSTLDFTTAQLKGAIDASITDIPDSTFRLEVRPSPGEIAFTEGNKIVFNANTSTALFATNKDKQEEKFIDAIQGTLAFEAEYGVKMDNKLNFTYKNAFSSVGFAKKEKILDENKLAEVLKPFFDKLLVSIGSELMVNLPLHEVIEYGKAAVSLNGENLEVKVEAPAKSQEKE